MARIKANEAAIWVKVAVLLDAVYDAIPARIRNKYTDIRRQRVATPTPKPAKKRH